MTRDNWLAAAASIRTIWFMVAMILPLMLAWFLGMLSLVITSPLMLYSKIVGHHLKAPRSRDDTLAL